MKNKIQKVDQESLYVNHLKDVKGLCLIAFHTTRKFYIKRSNNLKLYIEKIVTNGFKSNDKRYVPKCIQNELERYGETPCVYFILDERDEAVDIFRNMLIAENWHSIRTSRGRDNKENRILYRLSFNYGINQITTAYESEDVENIIYRNIRDLKKKLISTNQDRIFNKTGSNLEIVLNNLKLISIAKTDYQVDTLSSTPIVSQYNKDAYRDWLMTPQGKPAILEDIGSCIDRIFTKRKQKRQAQLIYGI